MHTQLVHLTLQQTMQGLEQELDLRLAVSDSSKNVSSPDASNLLQVYYRY